MKKIIVLSLLLVSYLGSSQIKVIKTIPVENIGRIAENGVSTISIQKAGDEYTIFYKNVEQEQSNSNLKFSFKDMEGDFENLYNLILEGYIANPMADIKLDLPDDTVWLHYTRNLQKVVNLQFISKNKITGATGISDFIKIEDVNSLFGKM